MNDFYKAVTALRSAGFKLDVTEIMNGRAQIATFEGKGVKGSIQTVREEDDQDEG